jgi:hypothetical protein
VALRYVDRNRCAAGWPLGHGDQVNVVAPQAIARQSHAVMTSLEEKTVEVEPPPVSVEQEDLLAVIAASGDGMRDARRHHPRLAGHGISVSSG